MLCKSFIISNESTVHAYTPHTSKKNGKEGGEGGTERDLTFESDICGSKLTKLTISAGRLSFPHLDLPPGSHLG